MEIKDYKKLKFQENGSINFMIKQEEQFAIVTKQLVSRKGCWHFSAIRRQMSSVMVLVSTPFIFALQKTSKNL